MAIIKLGGDSGGGGNVLSRVLKGCRVKEGEGNPGLAELAPKVILHPKIESSKQSSSVSSDFASKFLILENVPPVVDEVFYDECQDSSGRSSTQAPSLFIVPETVIPETATAHTITSYTKEFEKKAQEKRKLYIDVVEKSVKEIIKDEVKSQLAQILPNEISDFATPVIQRTITKSLENVVLAKSFSQPKSTYEAATSLTEFELKKILLDKLEKSKSYRAAEVHRNLYDALVKSYQLDKDLFDSYGKAYFLKRSREDKDKDEDPRAGPDQGLKKRKTKKVVEPPKSSKSKDSQSSSSKGTKSQSKSPSKSVSHSVNDTEALKLMMISTIGKNHARNGEWVDITIRKGASPSSEVMPLTFQPHSPKERPCLGIMKHTKPETQDSSNKNVSGTVTMLIDEKVNSNQKTQESNSKTQKTESSKSVDSLKMNMALPPRNQRHQYLRYEGLQYSDADIVDFETRLARIYRREVHRVHVFDFGGLPDLMAKGLSARMLMEHMDAQGVSLFTSRAWRRLFDIRGPLVHELILEFFRGGRHRLSWRQFILALRLHTTEEMETVGFGAYWAKSVRQIPDKGDLRDYWIRISSVGDFLSTALSYTSIRDPILKPCHRLIACSIAGRSQAHEKVTVTDLLYLRGMDVGSVNVPYLLAKYLRLFAAGRKSGALITRGQFVARLAEHFGLLTEERLQCLTVIAPALPVIDIAKLPDAAAGAPEATKDAPVVDEGGQAVPAPVQAPQQPPPPPPATGRTMPQRLGRLEEEVQGLQQDASARHFRHSMGPSGGSHLQHSRDAPGRGLRCQHLRSPAGPAAARPMIPLSFSKQPLLIANNAKFPYLEKEKYEIWAMKMEYWIQNADHNLWRIVQQGNSPKRLGKDAKGNTIVHPPVSLDEHVAVQRENKKKKAYIWDIQVSEDSEPVDINAGKANNEMISPEVSKIDFLLHGHKSLELDVRIGHSYSVKAAVAPTHSAFIGTTCSGSKPTYSDQQRMFLRRRQDKDELQHQHLLDLTRRKVTEVKTDEPKALVSVDSMVNCGADISKAAESIAMMEFLPRLYNDCYIKVQAYQHAVKTLESQKDILYVYKKLKNCQDYQEYFGVDECLILSHYVFYSDPVEKEDKPLYSRFVKAGEMHAVPPPITGTYMPSPYQSDIEETQVSYGSKSDNKTSETISESNDFVSCDNSDKSSDSETHASCDSSLKTKTKDFPPAVDIQTLPESDVEDPNSTTGSPSFSVQEMLKSPRILCNKRDPSTENDIEESRCPINVSCAIASLDETTRRSQKGCSVNFKTINKLAKEGLVMGYLPRCLPMNTTVLPARTYMIVSRSESTSFSILSITYSIFTFQWGSNLLHDHKTFVYNLEYSNQLSKLLKIPELTVNISP
ncbi:hypothetical protein Tco_0703325 [Tanacetum coccineum]|uniref:Uncharacterized protein n=1 Tax=Tanacetum coccineum TaxID=301880 RepID=A0ABQ4XYM0_9ASTR